MIKLNGRTEKFCQNFLFEYYKKLTSLTKDANWSLSLYTSSTVNVPEQNNQSINNQSINEKIINQ